MTQGALDAANLAYGGFSGHDVDAQICQVISRLGMVLSRSGIVLSLWL